MTSTFHFEISRWIGVWHHLQNELYSRSSAIQRGYALGKEGRILSTTSSVAMWHYHKNELQATRWVFKIFPNLSTVDNFDFNFLGYYIDAKNQCCCQINDFEAPKAGMWKFKNKMLSIEIWLNIFLRCRL